MIMYCYTKWKLNSDGSREPDLPDTVIGCTVFASLADDYCFCEFDLGDDFDYQNIDFQRPTSKLKTLLDSAKTYPPALALSLHKINKSKLSISSFSDELTKLLHEKLQSQHADNFILVESCVEQTGYLSLGEFVWAINYLPESDKVVWVSSDFQVYEDSSDCFDLSGVFNERFCRDKLNDKN